ncbi:MAG: hypothetical protein ACYDD6_12575, partial [Acidimicrobiales bacterium]
ERAEVAAELAGSVGRVGRSGDLAAAELVVQATPVGMAGGVDGAGAAWGGAGVDTGLIRAGQLVVDLVYHPRVTPLMRAAEAAGARAFNGLGMLVHQAALAVENWTGRPAPVEAMWSAARGGDTSPA